MRIRQNLFLPIILLLQACLVVEAQHNMRSLEMTFVHENDERILQSRQADLTCTLNEQGFFGEPIGDVYEIEYIYQIHVEAGTRISVVRVLVLPELDIKIAESILPSFFDCNTRRRLQTQSIEGVSWRSQDLIIETGCKYRYFFAP